MARFKYLGILVIFFISAYSFEWREIKKVYFTPGEKLRYGVGFGPIEAGEVIVNMSSVTHKVGNRTAYYVRVETKSHPFFDMFYKVRNIDEVWIDALSICCLKVIRDHTLPGYKKRETTILDHEKRRFRIIETSKSGDMSPFTQDTVSALYYLRTLDISIGDEFKLDVISGDKFYSITCKAKKYEKIKLKTDAIECLVIETEAVEKIPPFKTHGRLLIWRSKSDRKIMMLKARIGIGSISLYLKSNNVRNY